MQMLTFSLAVACGLLALGGPLMAQETAAHAPDGGTRQQIQSIDIPAMPNAPFTATVTTEWTRIMPDGTTATMKNHRTVARDGSGRVFQERRYFTVDGDTRMTRLTELDYQDPNLHQLAICRPEVQVCTVYPYNPPPVGATPRVAPQQSQAGMATVSQEPLGQKTMWDLEVVGSREVTTLNVGAIGNIQPQPIVKEFWYSPRLGINISTKRMDPRASAIQNFEVSNIVRGEPDPKLFVSPTAYRVVDTRQ